MAETLQRELAMNRSNHSDSKKKSLKTGVRAGEMGAVSQAVSQGNPHIAWHGNEVANAAYGQR